MSRPNSIVRRLASNKKGQGAERGTEDLRQSGDRVKEAAEKIEGEW